jgi:hypothetical protein
VATAATESNAPRRPPIIRVLPRRLGGAIECADDVIGIVRAKSDETHAQGFGDGRSAIGRSQFCENVLPMIAHRAFGNSEFVADLLVHESIGRHRDDGAPAPGKTPVGDGQFSAALRHGKLRRFINYWRALT